MGSGSSFRITADPNLIVLDHRREHLGWTTMELGMQVTSPEVLGAYASTAQFRIQPDLQNVDTFNPGSMETGNVRYLVRTAGPMVMGTRQDLHVGGEFRARSSMTTTVPRLPCARSSGISFAKFRTGCSHVVPFVLCFFVHSRQ